MAKLYTGKGDDGTTGLLGPERVSKTDIRLEVIGTLDELNSFLGNAKSLTKGQSIKQIGEEIQRDLYGIMSEIADTEGNVTHGHRFEESRIVFLEKTIAEISEHTVMPKGFILPGETHEAAAWGLCRTVARRAERRVVELNELKGLHNPQLIRYLNRLSSLFFILEVKASQIGSSDKFRYAKENL